MTMLRLHFFDDWLNSYIGRSRPAGTAVGDHIQPLYAKLLEAAS
jgi:hypothetical protein